MSLISNKIQKNISFKDVKVGDRIYHYFCDSNLINNFSGDILKQRISEISNEYLVAEVDTDGAKVGYIRIKLNNYHTFFEDENESAHFECLEAQNGIKIWNCYCCSEQLESFIKYCKKNN